MDGGKARSVGRARSGWKYRARPVRGARIGLGIPWAPL